MQPILLKSMSLGRCIRFAEGLAELDLGEPCRIDVSDLDYITPFGMLWCSFFIRRLRDEDPERPIELIGAKDDSYPAHMGFFQALGEEIGNRPGEAQGNWRDPLKRDQCEC